MAIRIIKWKKICIQHNITDFMGIFSFEEIDLRTPEGKARYKAIFRCKPRNQPQQKPPNPLHDIDFLFNIYNERDRRLFAGFLAKAIGFGGCSKSGKTDRA